MLFQSRICYKYQALKSKRSMSSHPLQSPKSSQTLQNHQTQLQNMQNSTKTAKPFVTYNKWTREQDILYVRFLKGNVERMKKTTFRKTYNKFKKMSEYIITKDSFQCRSHHQKMIKRHINIQTIIEKLSIKNAQIINKKPRQFGDENKIKVKPQIFEKGSFPQSDKLTLSKKSNESIELKEIENKVQYLISGQKQEQNRNKFEGSSFQTFSASKNMSEQIAVTGSRQMHKKKQNRKEYNQNCLQLKNVETCRDERTIQNHQRYYNQIFQNSPKIYSHQCPCHCEYMRLYRDQNHHDLHPPFRHTPFLREYESSYIHPQYWGLPYLYNNPQYPLLPYRLSSFNEIMHYPAYTIQKMSQSVVKTQVKQQE